MNSFEKVKQKKKVLDAKKLHEKQKNHEFYGLRSILGHSSWGCFFYIILGAREAGKSYSVTEYFVKKWKQKKIPFTWIRLNEAPIKKMLANNAEKFIDADIARKYDLKLTVKGNNVYDHGNKMAMILALSTFANDKGTALFDKDFLNDPAMQYHICMDEFQLEKTQRRQGDIAYQFVNQMENLVRSTKERMKIFLIGNTLEEASDILSKCFNFIPTEFGRYKLKSKKAVIDYIPPSEAYLKRRSGTVGDLLFGNQSNYTNKIEQDFSLIDKSRLSSPIGVIAFEKASNRKYTLWQEGIITRFNGENQPVMAMRPYLGSVFDVKLRDAIVANFDSRGYRYKDLVTYKLFQHEMILLKPRGSEIH